MTKIAVIFNKGFGTDGISSFFLNNYKYFDHSRLKCYLSFPYFIGEEQYARERLNDLKDNGDVFVHIESGNNLIKYCYKLYCHLRKQQFDLAYIHGSSCGIILEMVIAKLAGIKKVIPHSHNTTGNHIKLHRMLKPFVNSLATLRLGCGTEACRWMYGKKESIVIPNGIDVSAFKYNNEKRCYIRRLLNIKDDDIIIGHVGYFNEQKNHQFLLKAFADIRKHYSNVKLMCIGTGALQNDMIAKAKELQIYDDTMFLGQRTDVPVLLQAMDVFFLPSLFEGFPIVAIEAQASGLQILMSDKIAKEVALTDLVVSISIDNGTHCWLEAFKKAISIRYERGSYARTIIDKGFDISTTSSSLQQLLIDQR